MQKVENKNEEVSKEKAGEIIQCLNEKEKEKGKDKINNTRSNEIQNISMEEVRKIINENNQKYNAKLEEKIEKLEGERQ